MPTDIEVIDQLADYCAWLESELGSPMDRSRVRLPRTPAAGDSSVPTTIVPLSPIDPGRRHRRRTTVILGVGAAVAAIVAVTYSLRHEPTHQGVTPSIDTGVNTSAPADTIAEAETPTTYAPLALPDGLVVWDLGSIVVDQPPITEQLFGTYAADNTVDAGLTIRIQPATEYNVIDRSTPKVTVRGFSADNFRGLAGSPKDSVSLEWVEAGRVVGAAGEGISLDEAVTMLNGLEWRPNGLDGFDPASSTLPLITEQSSIDAPPGHALVFYVTSLDGPTLTAANPSLTDRIDVPGEGTVIVGDTSPVVGALAPDLVSTGTRQPDGSVLSAEGSTLVESDNTVFRFNGDKALQQTVLASLRPATVHQLGELAAASNDRLLQLPVIAATPTGPAQLLLRGGTAADPLSLCLRIEQDELCRSSRAQRQMPKWTEVVEIGTRWFIIGRQPSTDPPPVAFPWNPNGTDPTPADAISPDLSIVVGTDLLWYSELSPGLDAVGSGHLTDQGVLVDLVGRPSSGVISSGWSRPPW